MLPDRPRLRSSVAAMHDGSVLTLTALADGAVHEYAVGDDTAILLRSLDGRSTLDELTSAHPAADVLAVVGTLLEDGLLRDGPQPHISGPWASQLRFLDDLSAPGGPDASAAHDRLRAGHVVLVGVGGIGSWVAQALASVGVGSITVLDPDVVEHSNLNRQVLFAPEDVGRPKVDVVRERLARQFPQTRITPVRERVTATTAAARLTCGADLVLSSADEPSVLAVGTIVAAAAMTSAVPHIVGGAYGAAVGTPGYTVLPGRTPCFRCAVRASGAAVGGASTGTARDVTPPGPSAGSFAPLIGMVGTMTAWEACRVLLGVRPAFAGVLREFDTWTLDWRQTPVTAEESCGCAPT